MKNELFNELLASVQEMDEIAQEEKTASRAIEFSETEVKLVQGNDVLSRKHNQIDSSQQVEK